MMGWDDGGMNGIGPFMWVFMIAFWVALLALIVFLLIRLLPGSAKYGGRDGGGAGPERSEEILDRLFARGEIDEETYRSRRSALSEMRRS